MGTGRDERPKASSEIGLLFALPVLAGLAFLAALASGVKQVSPIRQRPRTRAEGDIAEMKKAIQIYRLQMGKLPQRLDDLRRSFRENPEGIFDGSLKDPWGRVYVYEVTGSRKFVVTTFGADGKPGGNDDDRDLDSDHLDEEEGGPGR